MARMSDRGAEENRRLQSEAEADGHVIAVRFMRACAAAFALALLTFAMFGLRCLILH